MVKLARPGERIYVLVTGSRLWTDKHTIEVELKKLQATYPILTVVHGGCRDGADHIADSVARALGIRVESHPANWQKYGKRAGFVRNSFMVKSGADLCLAFITNSSRGASHCAREAEKAGIPVIRFEETVPVVDEEVARLTLEMAES